MLKKAGAIAGIAAGLMMLGSPAFAATGTPGGWDDDGGNGGPQVNNGGLASVVNGNNVNAVVGLCGNNVGAGIAAFAVPINSPIFVDNCAAGGVVDGDDANFYGEND
ncbi:MULTISPECIES: hypothetical protein [unclassified Saccharothrix]|uniref:hypothetical protein n=1 Tax=unclassified Saccharothrix TaxID=2593673 RepID=UPI00307D2373